MRFFIIILGIIISLPLINFVHEIGHYAMARLLHVPVKECIFGNRHKNLLCKKIINNTLFGFNLYLFFMGETICDEKVFTELDLYKKNTIYLSGILVNITTGLLSFALSKVISIEIIAKLFFNFGLFSLIIIIINLFPLAIGSGNDGEHVLYTTLIHYFPNINIKRYKYVLATITIILFGLDFIIYFFNSLTP